MIVKLILCEGFKPSLFINDLHLINLTGFMRFNNFIESNVNSAFFSEGETMLLHTYEKMGREKPIQ